MRACYAKRGLAWPLAAAGVFAWGWVLAPGCSDATPAGECSPSRDRTCAGPGGASGAGNASAVGGATSSAAGAAGAPAAHLGAPCASDADCPVPTECVGPDATTFLGGGIARGACLVDCTDDYATCDAFEDAVCVDTSPAGDEGTSALCFAGCLFGGGEAATCDGRGDVACESLDDGEGFCRPMCRSDADCGAERRCDLRLGVCVPDPTEVTELALGAVCSTAGAGEPVAADCAGVCLGSEGMDGLCTTRCKFGTVEPCSAADTLSACLFTSPGGSLGDVGYCAKLCDCDDDCPGPGTACAPLDDATLAEIFGALGVCVTHDTRGAGGAAGTGGTLSCE